MRIRLSNTLSGTKENFVPFRPNQVLMYVCGPTVYNYIHIGNARPIVTYDLLYRLLKQHYKEVIYVRNITDVDDKIIKAAAEENIAVEALTQRYIKSFHDDIEGLNILVPSAEPRATEHIVAMQKMIEKLLKKGYAYEAEGHVLFEIATAKNYGCLSHQSLDEIIEGARVEVAPYKKHPTDFVLWKPSEPEQIGWDSPWGRGRPGWHLECSVMIETLLGDTIDIHGGGMDLVFPHHENEIAQSECAHDHKQFVRYWVHNGYITVKGDKMAKSVGNFVRLRDVLQDFPGECVRLALMSVHYKKPLDWTTDALQQARNNLDKWYRLLLSVQHQQASVDAKVMAALADDLNTPQAIAELHQLANEVSLASGSERDAKAAVLRTSANFIGLLHQDPQQWLRWQAPSQTESQLSEREVEALIAQRNKARTDKDFATADRIRDSLKEAGIVLEDSESGTQWLRQ